MDISNLRCIVNSDGQKVVPLNSMYMNCVYANFYWDFEKVPVHDIHLEVCSNEFGCGLFYLELQKLSLSEFKVSVCREHPVPSQVPDPGYFLEVIITIVGHSGRSRKKLMDHNADYICEVYEYSDLDVDRRKRNIWTVQFVTYMHEISLLRGTDSKAQNELIWNLVQKEKYSNKIPSIAFLLQRESLDDIFSGRQDYEFAVLKTGFIERSLEFVDDIVENMQAKKYNRKYHTKTSPDVYLCYILKNVLEPIKKTEALNLYILAHHLGLPYLVCECRDFMMRNFDTAFLVDILQQSMTLCDYKLLAFAIGMFIQCSEKVMQTNKWKTLLLERFPTARCILHFAQQRFLCSVDRLLSENEKIYEEGTEEKLLKKELLKKELQ